MLCVPGTSGSIGNGILGGYFPEREYNLLDPKRTRKRPKFQPWLWLAKDQPGKRVDFITTVRGMKNAMKDDVKATWLKSKMKNS